jgi:hypothetical protein
MLAVIETVVIPVFVREDGRQNFSGEKDRVGDF